MACMMKDRRTLITVCCYVSMVTVAVFPVSLTFNIDTTNIKVFSGEKKDFYGYKVLQLNSARNKRIIITAPLRLNGSGGISKHDHDQSTKWFKPKDDSQTSATVQHLGFSIAADPTGSSFTVCSPSLVHECHENMYLNSLCYNITDELQQISSFKPAFQECTKKTVDLVFLFDGSGSMTTTEFNEYKKFIMTIMDSLKNTSTKFAAAQFSTDTRTVFDFNDYKAGTARQKLEKEPHMKSLTNTYRALRFVMKELFENPTAGASPDSTQVLIIITDGDPSEHEDKEIIEKYNDKNIIRFLILVEKQGQLKEFGGIPSEMADKFVFKMESYDKLAGKLETFQRMIFRIAGNKVTFGGEMTEEMSQTGFSAVFYKDNLIVGSVRSNNCRGFIQQHQEQNGEQILDLMGQMDSYMGFSVSTGEKNGVLLYFTSAPRFNQTGQVVYFKQTGNNWITAQTIHVNQIGSYFGVELCSVDIDSDGNTDFLLVGAPMFYQPDEKKEGRVYVYKLTDEMLLQYEFNVTAPSMGRFGTTISSLTDLNGDALRDVAIGAPLEDDNSGVVYIYLGNRNKGIHNTFSQRISGEKMKPGIRFFGQAINEHLDLGDDGLPDIVVGSQDAAILLRSKPVFNVTAHLSVSPEVINTDNIDCLGSKDENVPMVNLTACFKMVEATQSKGGAASSGLNISYTVNVDPIIHRGFLSQTFTSSYKLVDKETCFNYSIVMPKCVKDLSPVNIKLNFSQEDRENASAILNLDSTRQAVVQVPFKKQCKKDNTCVAELVVDFNFTSSVLLTTDEYFNVSIKLENHGDDSYNTTLTMHYPPGLSFSTMTLTEATKPIFHSCHDLEGVPKQTVCDINLPLYRRRSNAIFKASFHVMNYSSWNDTMWMTIIAQSNNSKPSNSSLTKTIPVQFECQMGSAASTPVINVMAHMSFHPEVMSTDKINCLGSRDENVPMVNLTACFKMVEATQSKGGAASSGLNISYTVNVDPIIHRGFLSQTFTSSYKLVDKETCFNYSIFMPKCVKDLSSLVNIKSNFSQEDRENASAILNLDSTRQAVVEVPFKKQCKKDNTCVAELVVDFNFTSSVLLTTDEYFNVSIKLENHGDDSYNTTLTMHYPPGLSFSTMTLTEATNSTLYCHDHEGVLNKTVCDISLLVYRSNSSAEFKACFNIMNDFKWNDTMWMTIAAQSDNSNPSNSSSLTKTIPVQFETQMGLTSDHSNPSSSIPPTKSVPVQFGTPMVLPADNSKPSNSSSLTKTIPVQFETQMGLTSDNSNPSSSIPPTKSVPVQFGTPMVLPVDNSNPSSSIPPTKSVPLQFGTPMVLPVDNSNPSSSIPPTKSVPVQFGTSMVLPVDHSKPSDSSSLTKSIPVQIETQMAAKEETVTNDDTAPKDHATSNRTKAQSEAVDLKILPDQRLMILIGAGLGFFFLIMITVVMFKLGFLKRKMFKYNVEQETIALFQGETLQEVSCGPYSRVLTKSWKNTEL